MENAIAARTALLACSQQIEIAARELALSRALLEQALRALDEPDRALDLIPRIEQLLAQQLREIRQTVAAETSPLAERPGPFPLKMDAEARVARMGERRIPLSDREYSVLELLWGAMPSPVSRKALLGHLFEGQPDHDESAADWYIFQLRQKLKNAGCDDVEVRSIRGRGWVLEQRAVRQQEAGFASGTETPGMPSR